MLMHKQCQETIFMALAYRYNRANPKTDRTGPARPQRTTQDTNQQKTGGDRSRRFVLLPMEDCNPQRPPRTLIPGTVRNESPTVSVLCTRMSF